MTEKLAGFIVRRPWRILLAIAVVTAVLGAFVPRIGFEGDYSQMLPEDDAVVTLYERTLDTFGAQSVIMFAMAAPPEGSVFSLSSLRKLYAITDELQPLVDRGWLEEVVSAATVEFVRGTETAIIVDTLLPGPPESEEDVAVFRETVLKERQLRDALVMADGSAAVLILRVAPEMEDREDVLSEILAQLGGIADRYGGPEEFYISGDAPLLVHVTQSMRRDLALLFPVVVAVVAGTLFVSFRLWRGVLLPLAGVLAAVVWTLGFMSVTGYRLNMLSTFLPVLLVSVGSAYGIHVLNAFLQKAREGAPRERAVRETVEQMCAPVLAAALTTAAGFLTLLSSFLIPSRQFGAFAAVGVLVSFAVTIVGIPALLAVLPMPKARRVRRTPWFDLSSVRAARGLSRHPRWTLVVALVVLGLFLAGVPLLEIESDFSKYFREGSPIIQGQQFVERSFGGSQELRVVFSSGRRDAMKAPANLAVLEGVQGYLAGRPEVGHTTSLADLVKELHQTLRGDEPDYYILPDTSRAVAQLLILFEMGGGEVLRRHATRDFSQAVVTARVKSVGMTGFRDLIGGLEAYLDASLPAGLDYYVTGTPSIYIRISERLIQSQIISLGTSLGAVGLIVAVLLGSLMAGLMALIPLIVAISGNFGVMGYAGAYLDVATVMIASLSVGIGVDYAVHFLARYRRERAAGAAHGEALATTYRTSGRAIVFNAVTLMLGFLVMLLSSFGALVTFGWLITLTMVTTALGALFVLPAVLGMVEPSFLFSTGRLLGGRPEGTRAARGTGTERRKDHEESS